MGAYMFAAGVPDARIDKARKAVLLKIVADLPDDFFDPEEWPSPEGGRSTAAECRADLVDAVEFLVIARQSREVTQFTLTVGGHNLLVTGGMSNGDSPTDAYDLFNYIWHCKKLYKQLEEWAIEDHAAADDSSNGQRGDDASGGPDEELMEGARIDDILQDVTILPDDDEDE